mmetsp:Transcript_15358/g.18508  ORF Transcript_15358/g.18508 Transcript_15358/m.18508 type:complete len:321 (-) Transcript_15358:500-1462(-)|eukprot:CAMPEP_0197845582 /NCGR_PEP_ID=MMETSP1438-20131217/2489_1 /TAXON_ID=1461541 /ORGANISM="Pterosperma sp., Strain CCMP1384" /LENGTH=320 /DNA_ID=CAMNT_0043456933 /DNA_START=93 /DNA_END=1055 /DNA_ORIENTATION=+
MSAIAQVPTGVRLGRVGQTAQHSGASSKALKSSLFPAGKGKAVFGEVAHLRSDKCSTISYASGGALTTQANFFSRITRVTKSYVNSWISSAEDPEKLLDQTVIEMTEDLTKMRQATAQVMASQKQLENKYKQAQTTADDWYKRAQLALEKGDEDLARQALTRRKSFQENADGLKAQLEAQSEATKNLIANTRSLESKLAEAKSKKDTLKARAASAKTSKQVSEMVGSIGTSNAYAAFDRMEEKVTAMEAEAEATTMLTGGDALAQEFKLLEATGGVDDELAAMKKGLKGDSKSGGALPEGRKVSDAIDMELEELRRKSRD